MADMDLDDLEIKKFLSLFPSKVTNELSVVDYGSILHSLYHISTHRQQQLVPNISRRSAMSEDNTIPRVHTSCYLLGCIASVSNISHKVINNTVYTPGAKNIDKNYKGGWYIHALPFKKALRPSKKLVFDVERTNEHWLVSYSPEYKTYPAIIAGKLFPVDIHFTPRVGKYPLEMDTFHIEVSIDEGIYLTDRDHLTKGYWQVKVVNDLNLFAKSKVELVVPIDKSTYLKSKEISASMLSYTQAGKEVYLNQKDYIPSRVTSW